jgi:putative monooxygenase
MPPSTHAVVPAASVRPIRRQGGEFRFAITPATTTTTGGLMGELTLQAGERLIEHYHPFTDEYLYVVQGELTAEVEGDKLVLPAGNCLFIQRGAHHSFANEAPGPARAVVALSPLAPRPELGHVDCAEPVVSDEVPEHAESHR